MGVECAGAALELADSDLPLVKSPASNWQHARCNRPTDRAW